MDESWYTREQSPIPCKKSALAEICLSPSFVDSPFQDFHQFDETLSEFVLPQFQLPEKKSIDVEQQILKELEDVDEYLCISSSPPPIASSTFPLDQTSPIEASSPPRSSKKRNYFDTFESGLPQKKLEFHTPIRKDKSLVSVLDSIDKENIRSSQLLSSSSIISPSLSSSFYETPSKPIRRFKIVNSKVIATPESPSLDPIHSNRAGVKVFVMNSPGPFAQIDVTSKEKEKEKPNTKESTPPRLPIKSRSSARCNCRKSGCSKKYCECFLAGMVCNESCGCVDCHNTLPEITQLESRVSIPSLAPPRPYRLPDFLQR